MFEPMESRRLLSAAPLLPTIPATQFNVTTYGATGNGSTNDTTAIQNAINAAKNAGGGTVIVPAGTYLSNELTLSSSIGLQLASGATIQNATPSSTLITAASGSHDIAITGSGTIDGHATAKSSNNLVSIQHVDKLLIRGVTIANSSHEHLVPESDTNVTIDSININDNYSIAQTGGYIANTDAIDFSGSHFLIENSTTNAGDDDIVAKPGGAFNSDVTIINDTIGAGHGISVGGQTNDGLDGMTVSNITFNGTDNGLRLKAGRGNGGLVQNVSYDYITMVNVKHPLYITSYYLNGGDTSPSDPSTDPGQAVTSTTPMWNNITFSNVTATGASDGGIIYGLPEAPITNLSLINVSISGSSKAMELYHAHNVTINPPIAPAPLVYDVTYASTADTTPPSSSVAALPSSEPTTSFTLNWSGTDNTGGSGLANYDIYYNDNGGAVKLLLSKTTLTSTTFNGANGHRYAFYSRARDNAGNLEAAPSVADAVTTVKVSGSDTTPPSSHVNALPSTEPTASFTISWTGTDNTGGSGLANFDIYYNDNGGTVKLLLDHTTLTSMTFKGVSGHRYAFYSRARDNAGNLEAAPSVADAVTVVQ
jgi:polygalacturonase